MRRLQIAPFLKWFLIVAALYLAAVIAAEFFPAVGFFVVACARLTIGGLIFAMETWPSVQWSVAPLFNGLISLVVAVLLFHFALVHVSKGRASRPWRWKWSASFACVLLLLFGICLSATGVMTHMLLLVEGPIAWTFNHRFFLGRDLTHAKLLASLAASSSWSDAVREKQMEPADWRDMARLMSLPGQEPPEIWTWLARCDKGRRGEVPVLVSPRWHSPGKRLVAFSDGSARECSDEEYEAAIDRWYEARAVALLKTPTQPGTAKP